MSLAVVAPISYNINVPTFISPAQGSVVPGTSVTLVSSAFATTPVDSNITQTDASWYLYSDLALTQIVQQSLNDTVNLNSITFNNLTPGQTYYATVAYDDSNNDVTATSLPLTFTMQAVSLFDGRISTLPLVTSLTGAELIPIIKNNENLTARLSNIYTGFLGLESGPTIAGFTTVYADSTNQYTITNFNLNTTYNVSSSAGTVTISENIITLVAPATLGSMTFTVNNKTYNINVIANIVNTPSIIFPTSATSLNSSTLTATSSAFSSTLSQENQLSASWQLSTDPNFNTIFSSSINSISNLNSWTVNGLSVNTTYYIRVQYTGVASGTSAWSSTVSFSTNSSFMPLNIFQKLVESTPLLNANYGNSIASTPTGSIIVIGSYAGRYGSNSTVGSAYVYTYTGSSYVQTFQLFPGSPQNTVSSSFGSSVAISDDGLTIAVSDAGAFSSANCGYVCIYKYVLGSWVLSQTITTPNTLVTGMFGLNIRMSGDASTLFVTDSNLAVGATNNLASICVYNINAGQYILATQLHPDYTGNTVLPLPLSSYTGTSSFGATISINATGTSLIAFSPLVSTVYLYTYSSGSWTQTLVEPIANPTAVYSNPSELVCAMDLTGNYIAVVVNNLSGLSSMVLIYQNISGVWTNISTLSPIAGNVSVYFGNSLCFYPNSKEIFIGSFEDTTSSVPSGAVYLIDFSTATGNLLHTYIPNKLSSYMYFGNTILITQDTSTLFVNADYETINGVSNAGSVYAFN
jgi:hypothetical protein